MWSHRFPRQARSQAMDFSLFIRLSEHSFRNQASWWRLDLCARAGFACALSQLLACEPAQLVNPVPVYTPPASHSQQEAKLKPQATSVSKPSPSGRALPPMNFTGGKWTWNCAHGPTPAAALYGELYGEPLSVMNNCLIPNWISCECQSADKSRTVRVLEVSTSSRHDISCKLSCQNSPLDHLALLLNPTVSLRSSHSSLCLTVKTSPDQPSVIVQMPCDGRDSAQQFSFSFSSTLGTMQIHPQGNTINCLGFDSSSSPHGGNLLSQTCDAKNQTQVFVVYRDTDLTYRFVGISSSSAAGDCWGVAESSLESGANIIDWKCQNNPDQHFDVLLPSR